MARKDIQEPLRCNKCHEYGHFREKCINCEQCTNCAGDHATATCTTPKTLSCISCSPTSSHSSSNRSNCPTFTKHATSIDLHLPENTMPYFLLLGHDWSFAMSPRNNTNNTCPPTNAALDNIVHRTPPTGPTSQSRPYLDNDVPLPPPCPTTPMLPPLCQCGCPSERLVQTPHTHTL